LLPGESLFQRLLLLTNRRAQFMLQKVKLRAEGGIRNGLRIVRPIFLAGVILLPAGVRAESVQAIPADSFVEFIGLNAHLNWAGTIWQWEAPTLRQRMGELGIRYVRTAMAQTAFARDSLNFLYANYGIRANVLLQPRKPDGTLDTAPVKPLLAFLRDQVGAEKIVSFEGPNEYSETKYQGNAYWASQIRSFQAYLYTAVKSTPPFNPLPVLGPTIWRELESDHKQLGDLNSTTDRGTLHYYTAGLKPSRYLRKIIYNGTASESPIDMAITDAQINAPGTKIQVTELGYNLRPPVSRFYVTERTAAKYTLRLIAEFFLRRSRVDKIYLFSLLDADLTKKYGLLRPDLSRRPSFYAIKNAITLLADPGGPFVPDTLTYTLTGDKTDIRSVLLQKRDGRFYLLIWLDAVSYHPITLAETDFVRSLSLDISSMSFRKAKIYHPTALGRTDPNQGVRRIQVVDWPGVISLGIPDELAIVEMIP
jgi:hypothetical protein